MKPNIAYLAIDLSEVINAYQARPGMQFITQYYEIRDMIYDLLSQPPSPGETDPFYSRMDEVIPATIDLDIFNLESFLYDLFRDIDTVIINSSGKKYDVHSYILKGWLSRTTALLELEQHANTNNRYIPDDYFTF